jgi:hypothetical protein
MKEKSRCQGKPPRDSIYRRKELKESTIENNM